MDDFYTPFFHKCFTSLGIIEFFIPVSHRLSCLFIKVLHAFEGRFYRLFYLSIATINIFYILQKGIYTIVWVFSECTPLKFPTNSLLILMALFCLVDVSFGVPRVHKYKYFSFIGYSISLKNRWTQCPVSIGSPNLVKALEAEYNWFLFRIVNVRFQVFPFNIWNALIWKHTRVWVIWVMHFHLKRSCCKLTWLLLYRESKTVISGLRPLMRLLCSACVTRWVQKFGPW